MDKEMFRDDMMALSDLISSNYTLDTLLASLINDDADDDLDPIVNEIGMNKTKIEQLKKRLVLTDEFLIIFSNNCLLRAKKIYENRLKIEVAKEESELVVKHASKLLDDDIVIAMENYQ